MPEQQYGFSLEQIAAVRQALGHEDPDNKVGAHGLTNKQRKEIQYQQQMGRKLEQIPANVDPSFTINKVEAHRYHVLVDRDMWEKGKKLSKPHMQNYGMEEFEVMSQTVKREGQHSMPQNAFAGKVVTIVHNPRIAPKEDLTVALPSEPVTPGPEETGKVKK